MNYNRIAILAGTLMLAIALMLVQLPAGAEIPAGSGIEVEGADTENGFDLVTTQSAARPVVEFSQSQMHATLQSSEAFAGLPFTQTRAVVEFCQSQFYAVLKPSSELVSSTAAQPRAIVDFAQSMLCTDRAWKLELSTHYMHFSSQTPRKLGTIFNGDPDHQVNLKMTSLNPAVASVDQAGYVTPGSTSGTTIIHVATLDGKYVQSCIVTVDLAPAVEYALTVGVMGQGTTSPAAGTYNYAQGTEVDLTATPASGWVFDKWVISGATVTSPSTQVTMDANKTATAYFRDPDAVDTLPSELEDMMIIGGIGVSIDLLFDNNALAREKINEALADPDVTFADVLINFTRADQFFWLLTREAPTAGEISSIVDKITGYWDANGTWVDW